MMIMMPTNSYFPEGNSGSPLPLTYGYGQTGLPQTMVQTPNYLALQTPGQTTINPPSYVTPYPAYDSSYGSGDFIQQPTPTGTLPSYTSFYGPSASRNSWGNLLGQMGMMIQGFMGWFSVGGSSGVSPYTSNPSGISVSESSYDSTLPEEDDEPDVPTTVYPSSSENPLTGPAYPAMMPGYAGTAPNGIPGYGSGGIPCLPGSQKPYTGSIPANAQSVGDDTGAYVGTPDYTQYETPYQQSPGMQSPAMGPMNGGYGYRQPFGGMPHPAGASHHGGRRGKKSHHQSGGGHCSR